MNTVTVSDANVTTTGDLVKEIVLIECLVSYSAQLKYGSYTQLEQLFCLLTIIRKLRQIVILNNIFHDSEIPEFPSDTQKNFGVYIVKPV